MLFFPLHTLNMSDPSSSPFLAFSRDERRYFFFRAVRRRRGKPPSPSSSSWLHRGHALVARMHNKAEGGGGSPSFLAVAATLLS